MFGDIYKASLPLQRVGLFIFLVYVPCTIPQRKLTISFCNTVNKLFFNGKKNIFCVWDLKCVDLIYALYIKSVFSARVQHVKYNTGRLITLTSSPTVRASLLLLKIYVLMVSFKYTPYLQHTFVGWQAFPYVWVPACKHQWYEWGKGAPVPFQLKCNSTSGYVFSTNAGFISILQLVVHFHLF